ncbi:MAG: hypothetical protein ACOVNZ_03500, partial [Crocinitomicaceae bacterium]
MKLIFKIFCFGAIFISSCKKNNSPLPREYNPEPQNKNVKEVLSTPSLRIKFPEFGRYWLLESDKCKIDSAKTILNRLKRWIVGSRTINFVDYSDSIYDEFVPREFASGPFYYAVLTIEINEGQNEAFTAISYVKDTSWIIGHLLKDENGWKLDAFQIWKNG